MASWRRPENLLIFVFLFFFTSSTYAIDCANEGGIGTYYNDTCDGDCSNYPNTTCEGDDNGVTFCCFDLTQVPELPSWFGPFFLATLVAAWEYWRIHRRRMTKVPAVKKEFGR